MVLLAASFLGSAAPAASAAPLPHDSGPHVDSAAGAYYPVPAQRLLGTTTTGYAAVPGTDTRVQVAGAPGVPPSGLSAAVVNLTATAGSAAVALTAFPGAGPLVGGGAVEESAVGSAVTSPTAPPTTWTTSTTSATAPARGTRTTLVTVPLDPGGGFDVRTTGGPARLTIDLVGVYAADDTVVARLGAPGGYQPLDPVRLLGPGGSAAALSASAGAAATGLPSSAPTIDPGLMSAVPAGAIVRIGVDLGSSTTHVSALAVRASVLAATVPGTVDVTGGARPAVAPGDPAAGDPAPGDPAPGDPAAGDPAAGDPAAGDPAAAGTAAAGDPAAGPAAAGTAAAGTAAAGTAAAGGPDVTPTLSLSPGSAASNLAFVPAVLGSDGLLDLEVRNASSRPVDVRLDLVGFYDDGLLGPNLRFRAVAPTRVVDTAAGVGARTLAVGDQSTLSLPSTVAGDNTFALVGSATVRTTGLGADLAMWPSADPRPSAGSVPVSAGSVLSVPVQPELGSDGRLELACDTGPADLALDVVGSFESYPAVTDPATRGWVDAVPSWQVSAIRR